MKIKQEWFDMIAEIRDEAMKHDFGRGLYSWIYDCTIGLDDYLEEAKREVENNG